MVVTPPQVVLGGYPAHFLLQIPVQGFPKVQGPDETCVAHIIGYARPAGGQEAAELGI